MNQLKVYKYLEKFWLIVSIISVSWAVYIGVSDSWIISKMYFLLSAISVSLFFSRMFLRKRLERSIKEQQNQK